MMEAALWGMLGLWVIAGVACNYYVTGIRSELSSLRKAFDLEVDTYRAAEKNWMAVYDAERETTRVLTQQLLAAKLCSTTGDPNLYAKSIAAGMTHRTVQQRFRDGIQFAKDIAKEAKPSPVEASASEVSFSATANTNGM